MFNRQKLTVAAVALWCAGMTVAQNAPPAPSAEADELARAMETYSKVPDTIGSGRYAATKGADPAFPGHVVYRPANLNALGARKLPVLLWGNGGCADDGASARLFLSEIASHGYVVIAPGSILSGPGVPYRREAPVAPPPGKVIPQIKTTFEDVRAGLDQAIAANADRASSWHNRIDTGRVAVSGHSCGGIQALQLGSDPRIKAVIIHNSGIFPQGTNPIAGMTVDKTLLTALHRPILYVLGGSTDVAYGNGTDDFARIAHVPASLVNLPVGHGGTFMQPNGGLAAKITVAWLDWQLLGDKRAAKMFVGKNCVLCKAPGSTIERKRM